MLPQFGISSLRDGSGTLKGFQNQREIRLSASLNSATFVGSLRCVVFNIRVNSRDTLKTLRSHSVDCDFSSSKVGQQLSQLSR